MTTEQIALVSFPNTGITLSQVEECPQLVSEVLCEHHEALKRTESIGIRPMGLGLQALFWLLRLYVIFMVGATGLNAFQVFHH